MLAPEPIFHMPLLNIIGSWFKDMKVLRNHIIKILKFTPKRFDPVPLKGYFIEKFRVAPNF